ncbi:MAG: hypothetical protein WBW58_07815, partial [Candidatus Acidiferrum sp.]
MANTGLKVADFSVVWEGTVREAGKGVREKGDCRLEGLKVGTLGTGRLRWDGGIAEKGQRLAFTRHVTRDSYHMSIHLFYVLHGYSNREGLFER